ncbi:50S ribosomal protein L25 [Thermohalobacter berrensis]|uniref:Large ribosomal subunit protein bL25 n=1 Tax=Thermohalobacter berrensis TaxID=99594 RepID=A0A419SUH0_9FIRM|nr:50S ribosomal protein L25 [Thermohalobacter berrensis]RKD28816.1 hypothetical protein BET03_07240 [Thermohalobacter berrensis]
MGIPKLKAELRENGGKAYSKKLRKEGFLPGVIYGHNKETRPLKVKIANLKKILNRYGIGTTVNIELEGEVVPAIIKEVQDAIVKDDLVHVDFQQLSANEKIRVHVPIILLGKDKAGSSTSTIQQQLTKLEMQCFPKYIPQNVTVDVSNLEEGESITIEDLDIYNNENIHIMHEPKEIVASLTSTSREEKEEEKEEVSFFESTTSILDS